MKAWAPLLLPVSFIYWTATAIRNLLFDINLLPSKQFNVPVIGVGNLSVGGTGKTPHVEYLIRLLRKNYRVATISRGYGRIGNGFVLASKEHDYTKIGDEPLQYVEKFNDITVTVDNRRIRGIKKIIQLASKPEVILMDDSFQHRWVKPGLNILLTDFRNLYRDDYLLPAGTLRESANGYKRADIIIVTKTDPVFPKMLRQFITEKMKPQPHQKLLFSTIWYGELTPITKVAAGHKNNRINTIVLVAGIANPYPLEEHLNKMCENLQTIKFKDHHNYTKNDLLMIETTFRDVISKNKIVVTTEKDATRLRHPDLIEIMEKLPVYSIGIKVVFHDDDKEIIDNEVISYIKQVQKKA